MRLSSFGRSFLCCWSGRSASPRRALRLLFAAARRWPAGRLAVGWWWAEWRVGGCCGVMVSF